MDKLNQEMHPNQSPKPSTLLVVVFCLLILTFLLALGTIFTPFLRQAIDPKVLMITVGLGLLLFGGVLIFLTLKEKLTDKLKKLLLLSGISAVGVVASVILHNLVYGFFIYLLGTNFWDQSGLGDEGIFFILGVVIFPIGLLIGLLGSAFLLVQGKRLE